MNRVVPVIQNGNRTLVVSETFLAKKNEQFSIAIPVTAANNTTTYVSFVFTFAIDAANPEHRFNNNYANDVFSFEFINFHENGIAGNIYPVLLSIAGIEYELLFSGSVIGSANNIHFTFSLYKKGEKN